MADDHHVALLSKTTEYEVGVDTGKGGAWYQSSLALVVLLILLTVGDIVLATILFDQFGELYAQYLNQATAFVYCIASSIILLYRKVYTGRYSLVSNDEGGTATAYAPWAILIIIGLLNGSSNWLLAVAQPHTAGLTQSLFSVCAGVPIVMLLSAIFLHKMSKRSNCRYTYHCEVYK
jgi:hypothetical protein